MKRHVSIALVLTFVLGLVVVPALSADAAPPKKHTKKGTLWCLVERKGKDFLIPIHFEANRQAREAVASCLSRGGHPVGVTFDSGKDEEEKT